MLPSGIVGKEHIDECTRLILEWVNDNQLQSIGIKALMIMASLLLQKCSKNSKAMDHTESLKRKLKLWKSKLIYQISQTSIERMAKKFSNFMLSGKGNTALRLSDAESS